MDTRGAICVILSLSVLAATGCSDRGREKAEAEAAEKTVLLSKVRAELARAQRQIAELEEDLTAVAQTRDELDRQLTDLIEEHDKEAAAARVAREVADRLAVHSSDQAQSASALETRLKELTTVIEQQKATIAEQQGVIEELQKAIAEMQQAAPPPEQDVEQPVEPNEPETTEEA
jgi:chromosome segregation ATPase